MQAFCMQHLVYLPATTWLELTTDTGGRVARGAGGAPGHARCIEHLLGWVGAHCGVEGGAATVC